MINRKHLKAMLFAGFLGVMTLASTVPSMAATGWNKVDNQWVYYDSSGNLRKGWLGTSDGALLYGSVLREDDHRLEKDRQQVVFFPS